MENAGVDSRGGKCRSRLAVWKAEPRLYRETALSYFLKIVLKTYFIYLLLKSYSKYMIDREDRQMKIKTQTY